MSKNTIIINNINTNNEVENALLADLIVKMGIDLGIKADKPITSIVSMLLHKDIETET